jgi:hypothetical protein
MIRSSSVPAPTTWPGCTLRAETTPSTGARTTVKSRCTRAASRLATAVLSRARADSRAASASSASCSETIFSLASSRMRAALRSATSRLVRASATEASDCSSCDSIVRASSRSSTSPLATTLPTSTSVVATRRPDSSTPTDTSSHADTAPEATTSRPTLRCCGDTRVTVRLEAGSVSSCLEQAETARMSPATSRGRSAEGIMRLRTPWEGRHDISAVKTAVRYGQELVMAWPGLLRHGSACAAKDVS